MAFLDKKVFTANFLFILFAAMLAFGTAYTLVMSIEIPLLVSKLSVFESRLQEYRLFWPKSAITFEACILMFFPAVAISSKHILGRIDFRSAQLYCTRRQQFAVFGFFLILSLFTAHAVFFASLISVSGGALKTSVFMTYPIIILFCAVSALSVSLTITSATYIYFDRKRKQLNV